jgi:hypothetical protein
LFFEKAVCFNDKAAGAIKGFNIHARRRSINALKKHIEELK